MELTDQVRDVRPHTDPAALAQNSEDRRQLIAAVQRLTPEQQQVITMRFIDNLAVDEIARLMRRRVGAIHSMQHRALASLYRFLLEPDQVEARRA
jgi:RNA polymerase sigma-70 factor (ECF subfamily)